MAQFGCALKHPGGTPRLIVVCMRAWECADDGDRILAPAKAAYLHRIGGKWRFSVCTETGIITGGLEHGTPAEHEHQDPHSAQETLLQLISETTGHHYRAEWQQTETGSYFSESSVSSEDQASS